MVQENTVSKVAFTGITKLTYKCIEAVAEFLEVSAVFGLCEEKSQAKTNYFNLDRYCTSKSIQLFKNDDWNEFKKFCKDNFIDIIIAIGESRIIPKTITSSFYVIGNHGAVLPNIQGGASLVWGRMLNSGSWGVSIMKIDESIDSGEILKVKRFNYDQDCTEFDFVETCDNLTVKGLVEVLKGNIDKKDNSKWNVKINKHTDSYKAISLLKHSLDNNLNIYMPPRTPEDSVIKSHWPKKFIDVFKIAQDKPYPKWI